MKDKPLCALVATAIILFLSAESYTNNLHLSKTFNNLLQDSLPPLHTIKDEDIQSISTSFENHILRVNLKSGTSYIYNWIDWDYENYNPSIADQIRKAIERLIIIYSKPQYPPSFPGGESAWNEYINRFCEVHGDEIKKVGRAEIIVQFMVHLKGQITDVEVLSYDADYRLAELAVKAMRESPSWIPAIHYGRKVVCYAKQKIILEP